MSDLAAKLIGVNKRFTMGNRAVDALRDVNLELPLGKMIAIIGPSGSGKTTMLNMLGGLDRPSSGQIEVAGEQISSLSEGQLVRVHREKIGYVFQSFNLIPNLSALENVELPLEFSRRRNRRKTAEHCLEQAELPTDRWRHRPAQLSGGEQQRVAIARALATNATLILADEPTGNLDSQTGAQILALFRQLVEDGQRTIVLITHDRDVAAQADTIVQMKDGNIIAIKDNVRL